MVRFHTFVFAVVLAVAVLCAGNVYAELSKADEVEVNKYRLTVEKLSQFGQANKNLIAAIQKNPKILQNRFETQEKEAELSTIVAAYDSIPEVKKAIGDAGLTSREYWVLQLAMVYASAGHMTMKAGAALPEGYSKENVEFLRSHEAEFKKLDQDMKTLQKLQEGNSTSEDDEEMEDDEEDQEEEEK